ncbi:MAG: DUF5681 domain-containing protein [Alphaproteobacteria bacterium]|nr:DUF5681 domain-containing protein [Alphaproteobacteria bacterium]
MPKTSTSWKPEQSGNPAGRPKGSRDTINEAFLNDLAADWKDDGIEALRKAREDRPAEYCRMVAGLLPKEQNLSVKNDNPVAAAFMAAMKVPIGIEDENARLKEQIAALKGEAPEDDPEVTADPEH